MRIPRASALLNDAIEALDWRLKEAKGDVAEAWQRLTPLELEFVREEIGHCMDSRVYYLLNYQCIQPENGVITAFVRLWDHQQMVEDALEKERAATGQARIIVLKPRQAGISEYANGVMCWCTFFTPHAYTMSIAQDPNVAAHMQRKVNLAWERLPWWLRPERLFHNKGEFLEFGRKNLSDLTFDPGLGSVFVTTHAQRESGIAIGKTIRFLHLTEVSRWPGSEVWTADVEPSLNAPDTLAIAESTALGPEGLFAAMWDEAASGDSDWIPVFLPVYRAKKFSKPLKPSQLPFILTPLEQEVQNRVKAEEGITISNEFWNWRRIRIRSSIKRTGFPYAHYESYPMTPREAFQSSGICAFPRHKLDEQGLACVRRPAWVGEIVFQDMNAAPKTLFNDVLPEHVLEKREHHNRLYVWERPSPNEVYYQANDVGDGNGGDYSVCEIWRAGAGNNPDVQVAEWVGYEQPVAFARIVYALGFYYNRCEVAVEYAQEGMTTANYLMSELEYPNLYRPRNRDRIGKQLAVYLHWQTTSKTKPLIIAQMSEALLEDQVVIRSQYLLDEMYKFSKDGTGYSGLDSHDDSVMAAMICLFCLRETMPELRQQANYGDGSNQSPTVGARVSGGAAVVYGIYNQWFQLATQTRDLAYAQELIAKNPGYQIKPIPISKANTAFSVIHHTNSIERELLTSGVDSWDITPAVVSQYREATGRGQQVGYQMQPGQPAFRPPPGAAGSKPEAVRQPQQLSARVPAMASSALESEWLNAAVSGGSELGGEL